MNHSSLIYRGDFHENPTYRRPCTRQEADGCGPRGSQGQTHNLEETPAVDQKAGRDRPQRGSDGDRRRWGKFVDDSPPSRMGTGESMGLPCLLKTGTCENSGGAHDDL